jgi:eukaryotic-like serine/threonine-protein kinase
MFKGDTIKGYVILKDFTTAGGGLSKWTFARKNGVEYFMKEFLAPKYPTKDAPGSPQSKQRKKNECEKFEAHHQALMLQINEKCAIGGNLVFTVDFFRHESKYYKITEKVDVTSLHITEIATLPLPTRILILKTITHSLNILHKGDIVHGDLKPDNILIKQTKTGNFTAKLIDFDNSYFSGNPPEMSEDLVGDMAYYSPETARYIQQSETINPDELTTLSDIFALGLLFCQYLTGKMPDFHQEKYQYACIAVNAGQDLDFKLSETLFPPDLITLIQQMTQKRPQDRPSVAEIFDKLKNLDLKAYLTEADKLKPAALIGKSILKSKEPKPESFTDESPKDSDNSGTLRGKGLNILKDKKK